MFSFGSIIEITAYFQMYHHTILFDTLIRNVFNLLKSCSHSANFYNYQKYSEQAWESDICQKISKLGLRVSSKNTSRYFLSFRSLWRYNLGKSAFSISYLCKIKLWLGCAFADIFLISECMLRKNVIRNTSVCDKMPSAFILLWLKAKFK